MQGYFALNQPVLPSGWQLSYTPSGQPYYMDHNTKTTHWNPPDPVAYPLGAYYNPFMVAGPAGGGGDARGARGNRGGRGGIDQGKRKTKMCIYWEKSGECSWGDRCAFAHGKGELRVTTAAGGPQSQQPARDGEAPGA